MTIKRFEDIEAWQLARELTRMVYEATCGAAFSRDFALRDQIRSATGSSMHNIAEGFDGGSTAEFVRFLRYALRSCTEVQSELYVALDQNYINPAPFESIYEQSRLTRVKIGAFISYLRKNQKIPNPANPLNHQTNQPSNQ